MEYRLYYHKLTGVTPTADTTSYYHTVDLVAGSHFLTQIKLIQHAAGVMLHLEGQVGKKFDTVVKFAVEIAKAWLLEHEEFLRNDYLSYIKVEHHKASANLLFRSAEDLTAMLLLINAKQALPADVVRNISSKFNIATAAVREYEVSSPIRDFLEAAESTAPSAAAPAEPSA
jgi:hypothetical protein